QLRLNRLHRLRTFNLFDVEGQNDQTDDDRHDDDRPTETAAEHIGEIFDHERQWINEILIPNSLTFRIDRFFYICTAGKKQNSLDHKHKYVPFITQNDFLLTKNMNFVYFINF